MGTGFVDAQVTEWVLMISHSRHTGGDMTLHMTSGTPKHDHLKDMISVYRQKHQNIFSNHYPKLKEN
jgi:hypothetical protein